MPISQWEGKRKQLSYPPDPPTQNHCLSQTLRRQVSSMWSGWRGRPQPSPPQSFSSDQSPQSFSRSHFHLLGMQCPFSHWNWK